MSQRSWRDQPWPSPTAASGVVRLGLRSHQSLVTKRHCADDRVALSRWERALVISLPQYHPPTRALLPSPSPLSSLSLLHAPPPASPSGWSGGSLRSLLPGWGCTPRWGTVYPTHPGLHAALYPRYSTSCSSTLGRPAPPKVSLGLDLSFFLSGTSGFPLPP